MDPLEAAAASGDAVNGLGTHFMMDLATYAYGGELGYEGVDFYVAGRGGALGDVPADVVTAAFIFWEPEAVRSAWDRTSTLLPRREVAIEFAGVAHRWADDHIPDDVDVDLPRLADLAGRLVAGASVAGAPLFAGWRSLPEPPAVRAKALVIHRINALRELRGARHGAAVLSQGIDPHAAVARRTPYMLGVFGWAEPHPDAADVREPWAAAQEATERALAPVFAVLDEAERAEFAAATSALQAAVNPG